MTTFEERFVENKFGVLPTTVQETISNHIQDISCKLSRGPTVCIVKYKKFTMSGRTKEGLDEERKTKKRIEDKKEGKHPPKRAHWPSKKKSFHKKGSKKQKKSSKHIRTMRKRFFQAEQIKVYKKSWIECNSCNLNVILSLLHLIILKKTLIRQIVWLLEDAKLAGLRHWNCWAEEIGSLKIPSKYISQ